MSEPKCTCLEVYGEDPACPIHGRGTEWSRANPDIAELAEKAAQSDAKDARIEELTALVGRLKLEAQCHACEARTANSTIYEIYQVLSGATGEPGNWHGAEPARKFAARLSELTNERDDWRTNAIELAGRCQAHESRLSEQAKLLNEAREVVSAIIMARDKVAFRAARALLAKLNALHQENKDGK